MLESAFGPLFQEKTLEYIKSLGHSDLNASVRWLEIKKTDMGCTKNLFLVKVQILVEKIVTSEDQTC